MAGQTGGMGRTSPLVGRARELGRLASFAGDATDASGTGGRLLVVLGEAGMGKTRLLDELATTQTDDSQIVRGRADEQDTAAFGLWLGILNQVGLPRPGSDRSIPASEQRWDTVDLLSSVLGVAGPVLVVLDDLHWADDDSLWVLEHLLDRASDRPLGVIATTRPGSEARTARWHALYRRGDVLALDGLDVAEVAELAEQLGATATDAQRLWERTGGNPLFVREQVRTGDVAIPSTVDGVLSAAIERLGPETADIVSLIALAGPATPRAVLATAAGISPDHLERHLDAPRREDLIRESDGGIRFRHDLLAQAAVQRLGGSQQQAHHRALADAWSDMRDPRSEPRRAHHLLLAVPAVSPVDAAEAAIAVAGQLRSSGQPSDAASLLRQAGTVLADRGDVSTALKARVAVAEADTRWAIDDVDGATAASARALDHASLSGDPALVAAAEVVALTHHDPFRPDPVRIARLAAIDDALPAAHDGIDPVLRIRLRGRRAVLMASLPELAEEATALGEDAVARARALGDPEVVIGALRDRLFVQASPADFEAKARAADEILEVARATGRPQLALLGHEWRFAVMIGAADLTGAAGALQDLEVLATLMASPYWRYTAAVRRSGLAALLGDYEGALTLAGSTAQLGRGVVPEWEALGVELGLRIAAGMLFGRDDHGADPLLRAWIAATGQVPVMYLQAHCALGEALLGDPAASRHRLAPWLDRIPAAIHELEGLSTLSAFAHAAVLTGWHEAVPTLRTVLLPFAGRLAVANAASPDVSVDHHLAALALLAGDVDEARTSALRAVDIARRVRSSVLEARALLLVATAAEGAGDVQAAASARDAADALAEPLGMNLHPSWDPAPTARPSAAALVPSGDRTIKLRLDHGRWFVDSPFGSAHVADSIGMGQIVRLVTAPNTPVAAADLAGGDRGGSMVVASDLGPTLDGRAKREYRRRIAELRADIDEAEANNDTERAAKHQLELEAILAELQAAVGLGGRDRPQGSSNERARVNAARTIRRGIAALTAALPELGAHLDVSIRTGHQCAYTPEPAAALDWKVVS
jgi:hypothetical protein